MDPLTHTLAGAALADTGLRRATPLATATLVVGANLPDIDVLAYAEGADFALGFRRGWTHGVLAMVLLPLVLTAAMVAYDRWRRRRQPEAAAAKPAALLGLATLAIWSHPLLDWLNTYGIRLLMPFDPRWFYGDTLFIVDPWVWLLLGGGVFLVHSASVRSRVAWSALALVATFLVLYGSAANLTARFLWFAGLAGLALLRWRRPAGGKERHARTALTLAAIYAVLMFAGSVYAERQVRAALPGLGLPADAELMASPLPLDPFARLVLVATGDSYRFASWRLLPPTIHLSQQVLPTPPRSSVEQAALAAPCLHGMAVWLRYPFFEVEERPGGGYDVYVLDARYTRSRTEGFGGTHVGLDAGLTPECPKP